MNKVQINILETKVLKLLFKGLADIVFAVVSVPKLGDNF